MCDEAKNNLTRALTPGPEIRRVPRPDQTGKPAGGAKYNVPLDPIPTVLVKNNGAMDRYELEFRRGKSLRRKEVEYFKMVEDAFTVKVV